MHMNLCIQSLAEENGKGFVKEPEIVAVCTKQILTSLPSFDWIS